MTACTAAKAPTPPPPVASEADCKKVYQHLLAVSIDDAVESGIIMCPANEEAHKSMESELDDIRTTDGTKGRFMMACEHSMTLPQVACSLQATTIDGITACVRLNHHGH